MFLFTYEAITARGSNHESLVVRVGQYFGSPWCCLPSSSPKFRAKTGRNPTALFLGQGARTTCHLVLLTTQSQETPRAWTHVVFYCLLLSTNCQVGFYGTMWKKYFIVEAHSRGMCIVYMRFSLSTRFYTLPQARVIKTNH